MKQLSVGFWYHRTVVTLLILALIVNFLIGFIYSGQDPAVNSMWLMVGFISSGLAVVIGSIALFIKKEAPLRSLSLVVFLLLLAGTSFGLHSSSASGYVLLLIPPWIMIAIIGGVWSRLGLLAALTAGAVLLITPSLQSTSVNSTLILEILSFIVAPLIGYIGLRRNKLHSDASSSAYKELAQELSQVANKSEIVINAIGDGVIAINGKGIVQLLNPAAQTIMGWGEKDALDLDYRSIFKLSNPNNQQYDDSAGPVQQVLHGSDSITRNDLTLTTNSGKRMNISLLVSPLGKVGSGAIIVFRDITDEVNENKQRAEFISTASHEMRTPVAAIEGYLGLALNPSTATIDEKAREYIMKAHESAQHLGRLFQDLLDVSRAEDGRLRTNPTVVELVASLREVVNILTPKAVEKNLSLEFLPDINIINKIAPTHYAEVDPDHLREVMSNLIENAIKYTKQGHVRVDISSINDKVQISVSDTGIGIAREDVPHLFQKFYRIDNTDTREIGGTGLGLYLARRLVEHMNGHIWVESNQGSGSTFFVELDRMSPEDVEHRQRLAKQAIGL